ISGATFVPAMGAPFTLFLMPTSVVAPISLPGSSGSSSSTSGSGSGPLSYDDSANDSEPILVSFVNPAVPVDVVRNGLYTVNHGGATIRHDGNADLRVKQPGVLHFANSGEALISTTKTCTMNVGGCRLTIAPGSDVLIERNAEALTIRNLH